MKVLEVNSAEMTTLIIYKITHHISPEITRIYVGSTKRSLRVRFSAHVSEAGRNKNKYIGSLAHAIRDYLIQLRNEGISSRPTLDEVEKVFIPEEIEICHSNEHMRLQERFWAEKLQAYAPDGYNIAPAGSSIGGISNSQETTIDINGVPVVFSARSAALDAYGRSRGMSEEDLRKMKARVGYRMGQGSGLKDALDENFIDKRHTENTLNSSKNNIPAYIHTGQVARQKRASKNGIRKRGIRLPHPHQSDKQVSVAEFSELSGIPKSTVNGKVNSIHKEIDSMPRAEIIACLLKDYRRRKWITLIDLEGVEVSGSVADLQRKYARPGYGASIIGARMAKISDSSSNDEKLIAVGLKPFVRKRILNVRHNVLVRKRHCTDWLIEHNGEMRQFPNQAAYIKEIYKIISSSGVGLKYLGQAPEDKYKCMRSLQAKVSNWTRGGASPTRIADDIGILHILLLRP